MSIRLEDVSYIYEQNTAMAVPALQHITTEIKENTFIGLIGHTGSGKSTFVQLLNGLLAPTDGKVFYNDKDIQAPDFSRKDLRADVGLVFQYPEHQLFEIDVLTDVMFGPKNLGLTEEEARKRAEEALRLVGFEASQYDYSPFDLSGGQKRRVAIAGVLAMRPKYLILDEPTAGLDPAGRDEILEMIAAMQKELQMTVVLVSHSMEDVARFVDRIIVMDHGSIALDGKPQEVFSHVEELEKMGLAAPQISYIMKDLHRQGVPVNTDALTIEEAAEEILRVFRDRA
ncbi:MAG: energy-coupling factor transporter ATPase [Lachnospiraceae bacterium]|nr:energy-coupling factor transporter ATPase [Lachnospiraceae bacterium]